MIYSNIQGLRTIYLCLIALVTFTTFLVSADETMRHYVVSKGETLSGIAYSELGFAEAWLEIQKHNNVPNPKLLMPGTKLQIPESLYETNPSTASVLRVNGEAIHLSSLGEKVRTLAKGDKLTAGAVIETMSASSVVLQFEDNTRFFISENSRISLQVLSGKTTLKGAKTIINVEAGNTESRVAAQQKGAKYEVVTPEMRLAVRGTEFLVNVDPITKTTRAMIMEGVVSASQHKFMPSKNTHLTQGSGFIANESSAGSKVKLLPTPELNAIIDQNNPANFSTNWPLIKSAVNYRVQLFSGEEYTEQLSNNIQESQQVDFNNLADGNYELKVRAIDSKQMESTSGNLQFEINAFPVAPVLQAHTNKNSSHKKVIFNWQASTDADYYHFQIYSSDESNSYFSKIDNVPTEKREVSFRLAAGEYLWRVASVSKTDGQGPFSKEVKIRVNE